MSIPDRLEALLAQNKVTGIDFVYVHDNQTTLDVYFLRPPSTLAVPLVNDVKPAAIRIYSPSGGESIPVVPLVSLSWQVIGGRDVLRLQTKFPGDFSLYRLHIEDARIDGFYNDVQFSFKANCPSDLDCQPPPHECPPDPAVDFGPDYTARDFWSFRRALLDFASQRYPNWVDRLEADVGVMLAEVMSALGDEFAYSQDRIGREAFLETAAERRSLRRLARLVDYRVHDGLGAATWLDFQVTGGAHVIVAGTPVWSPGKGVQFEVGRGLAESFAIPPQTPKSFTVDSARNSFAPHIWDDHATCLGVGSTELYVEGKQKANLPLDDAPAAKPPGKWVLLQTTPTDPAVTARAWMVRVIDVTETTDPVFLTDITRLRWESRQATPFELDLTVLQVHGNLLPATAGANVEARFAIGPSDDEADHPPATERSGPNATVAHLFSLPGSDDTALVWLGDAPEAAHPEVRMTEVRKIAGVWTPVPNSEWTWTPALLGTNSAQPGDRVFTLDDGMWRRVVGYQRSGKEVVHKDYATGAGMTIRFGDGEFGAIPAASTIFQTTFRLGNGAVSNVSAGTLTESGLAFVASVTNPLPALGGMDEEPAAQVRQLAPEAFRAVTFRAVRPEDYAEAAERLPWVQRAGAVFRWTGSWTDAFVTPDPKDSFEITPDKRKQLEEQLDRFRQAGRPAYVLDPRYANIDLVITICVAPFAYRGEVEEQVLKVLFGIRGIRPQRGFFSPDNFTFGTPLERSGLEAAIQDVPGVKAVEGILIRRRGWFDWRPFDDLVYQVDANEIVRVYNDRFFPERGSVKLDMKGGA